MQNSYSTYIYQENVKLFKKTKSTRKTQEICQKFNLETTTAIALTHYQMTEFWISPN